MRSIETHFLSYKPDFIDVFLAFSRLGSCFESQQKNGLRSFIS